MNPNYEASAVNLCNPGKVKDLLATYQSLFRERRKLGERLKLNDVYQAFQETEARIEDIESEIEAAVDEFGSYQDVESGAYAIKQERKTATYDPDLVRLNIPEYAFVVLEKTVNKKKIEGLHKGGLITEEELRVCGKVTSTFSYIIRPGKNDEAQLIAVEYKKDGLYDLPDESMR